MKIVIECPKCREKLKSEKLSIFGTNYYCFYIADNGIIEHGCPYGHTVCIAFLNYKFDLLFETSLKAIKDMYYREAVATLASSLERFYEYAINVIMTNNSDKEKHWKFVANQSERQLGAFYYLFIQEFGIAPSVLSEKFVSFRNKVIHKGYIPTKEETMNFCQEVYDIIKNNYNILFDKSIHKLDTYKENYIELVNNEGVIFSENQKNKYKNSAYKVEDKIFFENISTFLFSEYVFNSNANIEKYIEGLKKIYN